MLAHRGQHHLFAVGDRESMCGLHGSIKNESEVTLYPQLTVCKPPLCRASYFESKRRRNRTTDCFWFVATLSRIIFSSQIHTNDCQSKNTNFHSVYKRSLAVEESAESRLGFFANQASLEPVGLARLFLFVAQKNQDDVPVAHKRGFVAKVDATDPARLQELLGQAVANPRVQ